MWDLVRLALINLLGFPYLLQLQVAALAGMLMIVDILRTTLQSMELPMSLLDFVQQINVLCACLFEYGTP